MLISSLYGVIYNIHVYTPYCRLSQHSHTPPPSSSSQSLTFIATSCGPQHFSHTLYLSVSKMEEERKNPANSLMYRLVKSEMYTKIRGIMLVVAVGPPCVVHQWWFLLILSHPFFHWMPFNVRGNMKFFYKFKNHLHTFPTIYCIMKKKWNIWVNNCIRFKMWLWNIIIHVEFVLFLLGKKSERSNSIWVSPVRWRS